MKLNIHTIGFVTLLLFIAAIKCGGAQPSPPPITGTITFSGSGISITPGEGWYRCEPPTGAGVFFRGGIACGPTIVSESGMLSVGLMDKHYSSLESVAVQVREEYDSILSEDRHSLRREPFVTDTGLRGLHVSYVQRSVRDGRAAEVRCHHYVVTNRDGRVVDVAYLADARHDTNRAHEMIRQSLSLQ